MTKILIFISIGLIIISGTIFLFSRSKSSKPVPLPPEQKKIVEQKPLLKRIVEESLIKNPEIKPFIPTIFSFSPSYIKIGDTIKPKTFILGGISYQQKCFFSDLSLIHRLGKSPYFINLGVSVPFSDSILSKTIWRIGIMREF